MFAFYLAIGFFVSADDDSNSERKGRLNLGDPPDRIRLHLPYSREASLKCHTKSPDCIINPFLPPLSLAACLLSAKFTFLDKIKYLLVSHFVLVQSMHQKGVWLSLVFPPWHCSVAHPI